MATSEQAETQERWNEIGSERLREIEQHPDRYRISACPVRSREFYEEFLALLSPIPGKRILELGFGRGELSVWLAMQGAEVTAVDLGHDLVSAAGALARLNGVSCDFRQGDIAELGPIGSSTFDVVLGVAILHHLPEAAVVQTVRESHRVLKPGGLAIFVETIENSKWFDMIQNLFPAGRPSGNYYRPSLLNRSRWKAYIATLDERAMTDHELLGAGQGLFKTTRLTSYGLMIRLVRLFGAWSGPPLMALDRTAFRFLPFLKRYARMALVVYSK